MENQQQFTLLFQKYLESRCSPEEVDQFMILLSEDSCREIAGDLLKSQLSKASVADFEDEGLTGRLDLRLRAILETTASAEEPAPSVRPLRQLKTAWLRYAAILLLFAGAALYLYKTNSTEKEITITSIKQPDILPGGNKAILTLSDGSAILLDSAATGPLATQGGTRIIKPAAGSLTYQTGIPGNEIGYNTVSTPNGGQYQITMPDGTKVWLNAASSIRFPTAFVKERKVTVTGEVYMEVAEDRAKPFIVTTNGIEVQVLGTSFNINAYNDEPFVKTTLLEGSIRIIKQSRRDGGIILKPRQQAIIKENIILNKAVDVEQATAWKNGVFNFNGATLDEFMRQLSRWYDLKIVYQGKVPQRRFKGEMGRDLELSQIMEMLDLFKIKYKREGRTVTIESQ